MTTEDGSPSQKLLSAILASRDDGEFSDLVLRHAAGSFKVHRIIVCPQSRVLHKACSWDFKEASIGVVEMADMSYLELKKMVGFLYSTSYDDEIPEETKQEAGNHVSLLQLHARMFALGDRFDVLGLREVAVKKYLSRGVGSWEPLEFLESIYDVYRRTPTSVRQLRNVVGILVRKNLQKMLDDEVIAKGYDKVLDEVPEFTKDLLGIYTKAPLYKDCLTCSSNQAF